MPFYAGFEPVDSSLTAFGDCRGHIALSSQTSFNVLDCSILCLFFAYLAPEETLDKGRQLALASVHLLVGIFQR